MFQSVHLPRKVVSIYITFICRCWQEQEGEGHHSSRSYSNNRLFNGSSRYENILEIPFRMRDLYLLQNFSLPAKLVYENSSISIRSTYDWTDEGGDRRTDRHVKHYRPSDCQNADFIPCYSLWPRCMLLKEYFVILGRMLLWWWKFSKAVISISTLKWTRMPFVSRFQSIYWRVIDNV